MRPTSSQFTNPSGLIDKRLGKNFEAVEYVRENLDKVSHLSYYMESLFNLDRNLTLLSDENVDHHILKDITIFQGPSAYELALKHGFVGTEEEWLASLKGAAGDAGPPGIIDTLTLNGILESITGLSDAVEAANLLIAQNAQNFSNYATTTFVEGIETNLTAIMNTAAGNIANQIDAIVASIPSNSEILGVANGAVTSALVATDNAIALANTRIDGANALLDSLRDDLDDGTTAFNSFLLQNDQTLIRLTAMEALSGDNYASIIDLDTVTSEMASKQTILQAESDTHNANILSLQQVTADSATQLNVLQVANNEQSAEITNLQSIQNGVVTDLSSLTLTVDNNFTFATATRSITDGLAASLTALGVRTDAAESSIINLQTVTTNTATSLDALTVRTSTAENSILSLQSLTSTTATSLDQLEVRVGDAEGIITTLENIKADQTDLLIEAARITNISAKVAGVLPPGIEATATGSVTFKKNFTSLGANAGEILVVAGSIERSAGRIDVSEHSISTPFEGSADPTGGEPFYVVWSATDASVRFTGVNTSEFFISWYDTDQEEWRYFESNSVVDHVFTPNPDDQLVGRGFKAPGDTKITQLLSLVSYTDIQATITSIQSTYATKTELFDEAAAIQVERQAAETAASNAQTSEQNAAQSYSDAQSSAAAAFNSQSLAAASENSAGQSAGAAATYASTAATYATDASNSASASNISSVEATSAVIETAPSDVTKKQFFSASISTDMNVNANLGTNWVEIFDPDIGPGLKHTGKAYIAMRKVFRFERDDVVRFSYNAKTISSSTSTNNNVVMYAYLYDAGGSYLGAIAIIGNSNLSGHAHLTVDYDMSTTNPDAVFIKPYIYVNGDNGSDGVMAISNFKVEFITDLLLAQNAANASATSASSASASENAAGLSATAADASRVAAEAANTSASAHSNTAATSASNAASSASSAFTDAGIAANASIDSQHASRDLLPSTMENANLYFSGSSAGHPDSVPDISTSSLASIITVSGESAVQYDSYGWMIQKGVVPISENRVWKVEVELEAINYDQRLYLLIYPLTATYGTSSGSHYWYRKPSYTVAEGRKTVEIYFTNDSAKLDYVKSLNNHDGGSYYVDTSPSNMVSFRASFLPNEQNRQAGALTNIYRVTTRDVTSEVVAMIQRDLVTDSDMVNCEDTWVRTVYYSSGYLFLKNELGDSLSKRTDVSTATSGAALAINGAGQPVIHKKAIPVDTNRRYRIKARIAQNTVAGDRTIYMGLACYDENLLNLSGYGGTFHYILAYNTDIPSNFTEYERLIQGEYSGSADPYKFPPGTKYVRPMLYANYPNGTGQVLLDHFSVEDVTSEILAEGYASAAATSQSSAAASATLAGQSAITASSQASNAATSAANALTHANNAASSSTNAAGSASSASTSEGIAVSASELAYAQARTNYPKNMQDITEWSSSVQPALDMIDRSELYTFDQSGPNILQKTSYLTYINGYTKHLQKLKPGNTYRSSIRARVHTNATNGSPSYLFIHGYYYNSDGTYAGDQSSNYANSGAKTSSDGWFELTSDFVALDHDLFVPRFYLNYWSASPHSNARWEISHYTIEDVTSEVSADNSASAAATSASNANASATSAGQYASSSLTHANSASTAAGDASVSATSAATSATSAQSAASSAQAYSEVAARVQHDGWLSDPTFANYPNTTGLPTSLVSYYQGANNAARAAGDYGNEIEITTDGSSLSGFYAYDYSQYYDNEAHRIGIKKNNDFNYSHAVIEFEGALMAGAGWGGSYIQLYFGASSPGPSTSWVSLPSFAYTPLNNHLSNDLGRYQKLALMVPTPVAPSGYDWENCIMYFIADSASAGGWQAKTIRIRKFNVRPATEAEVDSGKIQAIEASVITNSSAIASANSSIATLQTDVSTANSNAGIALSAAQTNSNTLESTVTFYANAGSGGKVELRATDTGSQLTLDVDEVIAPGTINADRMNVSALSALTADVGVLRTATTGQRLEIRSDKIVVYDSNNVVRVKIGNLN